MIHPSAIVHESAKIAEDAFIGPNVVIGENVTIGSGTRVIANAYIDLQKLVKIVQSAHLQQSVLNLKI